MKHDQISLDELIEHRAGKHIESKSMITAKQIEREELERKIAEFEAKGGTIKQMQAGATMNKRFKWEI